MATAFITDPKDPIIQMVRDYNVILSQEGSFKSKDILVFLNNHAFPRIRGRLLTATDSTNKHIFYDDLGQLANPTAQVIADQLVVKVMTDTIVRDYVFRIAAALTASWRLRALAGQVPEQQALGNELEKQALADLDMLIHSPELSAAAAQAKQALGDKSDETVPKIYMALDINPATFNATTSEASPYTGADEDGTARLWVGPYTVEAQVVTGDTPGVIMSNLLSALRSAQRATPPPAYLMNLIIGPNEGPLTAGSRPISARTPTGQTVAVAPSVYINLGWLSFHSHQYDPYVDALFCTLELTNTAGLPGIRGIVYGQDPEYRKLTNKGPYSVFLDVKENKKGSLNPALAAMAAGSNAFFFTVGPEAPTPGRDIPSGGVTPTNGVLRYQISNLVPQPASHPDAPQPRTVIVPAGSDALAVVKLIAADMASIGFQQRVLPAIRSPMPITVMGSPVHAPGLEIVPYRPSGFEDKIVFDMLEVPTGVYFGVLPPSLVTNGAFDNKAKSLVLDVRFVLAAGAKLTPLSGYKGRSRFVENVPSRILDSAFRDIQGDRRRSF